MKLSYFVNALFCGVLFFWQAHLCADETTASNAVKHFWSFLFNPVTVHSNHLVGNLRKYTATFPDSRIPQQEGYVDTNGQFITVGSTIITSRKQIAHLLQESTLLPSSNDIANLQAYLNTSKEGMQRIIFIDAQNQYALAGGQVYQLDGFLSTFAIANTYIPNELASFIYDKRQSFGSFIQGDSNAPRALVIVADPNCSACHDTYEAFQPFVNTGQLSIHWTFVSFISATSREKAAAILQGDVPKGSGYPSTPQGALAYNQDFFSSTEDLGGIPPARKISFNTNAVLGRSLQYFVAYTSFSTPFIIYKNALGQPAYHLGQPPHIADLVNNVYSR